MSSNNNDSHCQPAARIIAALGGVTAVAARTRRDVAVVRRWRLAEPIGTGGRIPEPVRAELLAMARDANVDLAYVDFAPPTSDSS